MKKEEEIAKICRKESRIILIKECLIFLFFLTGAFVFWVFIKSVSSPAADPFTTLEYDRLAMVRIIITFSIFAILVVAGYFYNKALTKKLEKLWRQKLTLF